MSTHTPGPWMVEPCSDDFDGAIDIVSEFSVGADERKTANWIASCDLQDDRIEENHANAHLIAAAPEMYEALKAVERHCPCGARPESPHTHPHVTGCLVALALAKADAR